MRPGLLHPERDAELERSLPANAEALEQDLALGTLLDVMAHGDRYLREVAERELLSPLAEPDDILYRQRVLADCLAHPALVRQLYALAVEGIETKRKARFFWFRDSPEAQVQKSRGILLLLTEVLKQLRAFADEHAGSFSSAGFSHLFETLQRDLDDDYLATIDRRLHELEFPRGTLASAALGRGNRGSGYVLRAPNGRGLLERLTAGGGRSHSFSVAPRDEAGLRALSELRGRALSAAGNALAQSTDHILGFFATLRAELGFYVACLNLHERLAPRGATCFPVPEAAETFALEARGLYDAALAFHLDAPVVGSDVDADGARLLLVTGANQGGKSTFLRSVGIAQLMMQAGMFVAASSLRAAVCGGVFTHFKREEDATMTRGKLDEELARMSEIADLASPHCLVLGNESFAATNEREGSEIARHVIRALVDSGVRVVFVTHLFELAHGFHSEPPGPSRFLVAERRPDGERTFRMVEGAPKPTSHGADSFRRIFREAAVDAAASG